MKELHGTEWYGEYATLTDEHNDYVQIEYKCNGTGRLYDYTLFPGIDLIFMDFNCSDTFHEPIPNKNIIEIRHYQKGRVEFELRNNKVFHMKEGEFCINALANIPAAYSFPFGYSVGLSCVIDKDSVDVETQQIFSYYNIDVLNLGRELELEKKWFLCRTPQRLLHIFEELYAAKGVEERDYVSFSYEADSQVKALSHVSFFADQGKVTAIVGPSGGGKSTIASLISRFYDVTDGSIQIGGVDIRDIPLDALMDKVSFVFQDTFLFKQSILDNIRMGNPDATEEQVIAAAKAARCHEFIEQLPNGYQTVIGSTGVHLSGGERQRIAIARAIVKDAPIIVLDEATAFSDPENEYLIQKAFEKLIQNKTVVMIAHRLSTIRNADQILIMEKGCLIESGTHDELLKKDGKYAQMWSSYTESINWKIGTGKAV